MSFNDLICDDIFAVMDIVKFTKDNTFQRIKAWYIDEESVELTPEEILRKDRLVHIWSLRLNNKYSPAQSVKILIRDHNVSQATAYRDYSLAMELFGSIDKINLAAERMVLVENYWNLYQMALKKGNEESARKALDSYTALFDFDHKEATVDPKKLEASVYKLNLPRGSSNILKSMFEGGVVDFNKIGPEDVTWKEVNENVEEAEEDE